MSLFSIEPDYTANKILSHIYTYQEAACTARICFTAFLLHGTPLHVASKEPHCTALHGPAGKATMHGFARKTCKWIPNFTDLHGTAWKVPVHMDPNLAALMGLNSA